MNIDRFEVANELFLFSRCLYCLIESICLCCIANDLCFLIVKLIEFSTIYFVVLLLFGISLKLEKYTYHKLAIAATSGKISLGGQEYDSMTLQDIMKKFGHSYVDVMKMDIGMLAEYEG